MKIVKRSLQIAGTGLLGVALSGCMAAAFDNYDAQQFGTTTAPATSAANVVLATNTPNCKYQTLGSISVRDANFMGLARSGADVENDMQTQAAKMGGNAVTGIKLAGEFYTGTIVYISNIHACKGMQTF